MQSGLTKVLRREKLSVKREVKLSRMTMVGSSVGVAVGGAVSCGSEALLLISDPTPGRSLANGTMYEYISLFADRASKFCGTKQSHAGHMILAPPLCLTGC